MGIFEPISQSEFGDLLSVLEGVRIISLSLSLTTASGLSSSSGKGRKAFGHSASFGEQCWCWCGTPFLSPFLVFCIAYVWSSEMSVLLEWTSAASGRRRIWRTKKIRQFKNIINRHLYPIPRQLLYSFSHMLLTTAIMCDLYGRLVDLSRKQRYDQSAMQRAVAPCDHALRVVSSSHNFEIDTT